MEKRTSPENKLALKRVLAQEGNGRCADCKTATHPRWASWNIGILICIRCSGIHRSLGTHISKVRSIDLDTWNDQQLEKLLAFGNTRANAYWEAKLKPGYVPDEAKIANFIKTKYELKRWIPEDDDTPLADVRPGLPPRVRPSQGETATAKAAQPPQQQQQGSVDLLDLDGAFNVRSKSTTGTVNASRATSPPSSLFSRTGSQHHHHHNHHDHNQHQHHHHHHFKIPGLHHPQQGRPTHSQSHQSSPQPSIVQPPPRPASQPPRSDIKKSILALYSDKQPERQMPRSQLPRSPAVSSASNSTSALQGSLANLSFSPPRHPSDHQPSSSSASSRFDQDFEDESFANVWQR